MYFVAIFNIYRAYCKYYISMNFDIYAQPEKYNCNEMQPIPNGALKKYIRLSLLYFFNRIFSFNLKIIILKCCEILYF